MRSYIAFGLGIKADFPLPELPESDRPADVVVHFGQLRRCHCTATPSGLRFFSGPDEIRLTFDAVGSFLIRGKREIIVHPESGVEECIWRLFLLGPVLAVLLQIRGLLILHASAVEMRRGAVAFLGGSGWGKSTVAAFLQGRGYNFVSDDTAALWPETKPPLLLPGYPQIKLWPDAASRFAGVLVASQPLHSRVVKRVARPSRHFSVEPRPLGRLYVLAEGDSPAVEPLLPRQAFIELVRHSYCGRLLRELGAAPHFLQCARVANQIPVRRLRKGPSLSALSQLAALIENDFA